MESSSRRQVARLEALLDAGLLARHAARSGTLFCSTPGLALVNAAFDLFECDALYDLAADVGREVEGDGN